MYTTVEENYIKAIYHLSQRSEDDKTVKTTKLSQLLNHRPSTTTETLDRLAKKRLIWYQKYKGADLSPTGQELALKIIRRHRLWESFLMEKLDFTWDEVHEIAEELEHIRFPLLIERLDDFLKRPQRDPHGEPIPNRQGKIDYLPYKKLSTLSPVCKIRIEAVTCDDKEFLRYLSRMDISIGKEYKLTAIENFDKSMTLMHKHIEIQISHEISKELLVIKIN